MSTNTTETVAGDPMMLYAAADRMNMHAPLACSDHTINELMAQSIDWALNYTKNITPTPFDDRTRETLRAIVKDLRNDENTVTKKLNHDEIVAITNQMITFLDNMNNA